MRKAKTAIDSMIQCIDKAMEFASKDVETHMPGFAHIVSSLMYNRNALNRRSIELEGIIREQEDNFKPLYLQFDNEGNPVEITPEEYEVLTKGSYTANPDEVVQGEQLLTN